MYKDFYVYIVVDLCTFIFVGWLIYILYIKAYTVHKTGVLNELRIRLHISFVFIYSLQHIISLKNIKLCTNPSLLGPELHRSIKGCDTKYSMHEYS